MKSDTDYLREAQHFVDTAEKERRSLTENERRSCEAALKEVRAIRDNARVRDEIERMNSGFARSAMKSHAAPGFGAHDPVAMQWSKAIASQCFDFSTGKIAGKALTVPSPISPAPTSDPVAAQRPPIFVVDLFPVQATDNSEEAILAQTVRTNNAAPVARGAAKPESVYTLTRSTVPIVTIAHLISSVDNQDLADARRLEQFIRSEMLLGLRMTIEAQLLNGSGAGANIRGIFNTSGTQSQAFLAGDLLGTIRRARRLLEEQGFTPNGLVVSPTTKETIDTTKSSDGEYLFAGPQDSGPGRVWGIPTVISNALPANSALLGDFNQAVIFARDQATVEVDPYSAFGTNQTRFRAEQRLGLGVVRPAGFVEIALA